jgi:transcriptional regulator with XRE-family HTH domain
MSKRAKIYQTDGVKENIGAKLKAKRLLMELSLSDIADMTDFSKSTVINLENGIATNIDYYIGYALAVDLKLPKLFDIPVIYKPQYELSEDKKNRIFLSKKIRVLLREKDFFNKNVTVDNIITYFEEQKELIRSKKLSIDVSRILLNWVEDGELYLVEKRGRNNVYRKV